MGKPDDKVQINNGMVKKELEVISSAKNLHTSERCKNIRGAFKKNAQFSSR